MSAASESRAVQLFQQGRHAEAKPAFLALVQTEPSAAHYNYLGLMALQAQRYAEAGQYFAEGAKIDAQSPEIWANTALLLIQLKQWSMAENCARTALQLKPNHPPAFIHLGLALSHLGRFQEVLDTLLPAWPLLEKIPNAPFLVGTALLRLNRLTEALGYLESALQLLPNFTQARNNYGTVLYCLGRLEEAHRAFAQVLEGEPEQREAHVNRATLWLLQGRYDIGWREFHWRFQAFHLIKGKIEAPLWNGQPFPGQTLLLVTEQGFGDTLQFVRFARLVKPLGGRVVLECQRELVRLLRGVSGVDQIIARDSPRPDCAYYAPLLCLPEFFCPSVASIPAEVPYLQVPAPAPSSSDARRRVGVCWFGSGTHVNNLTRSCPHENMRTLLETPGIRFISLQKFKPEELPPDFLYERTEDGLAHCRDFLDTARVVAGLDLIITVDTAMAHLAGALGKPVWLMLAHHGEWRWLLQRSDSPWYPTARLFRQPALNDWAGLIDEVRAALESWQPNA